MKILGVIGMPCDEDLNTIKPEARTHLLKLHKSANFKRQDLSVILDSPDTPDVVDLVTKLLLFNEDQRLTAADALLHDYIELKIEKLPILRKNIRMFFFQFFSEF